MQRLAPVCALAVSLSVTAAFAQTSAKPGTTDPARSTVSLSPGNHTFSLRVGGRNREYIVHVPAGASGNLPLLLAFHGGGGDAVQFQNSSGIDVVADREKFLVVYPFGTGVFPRRLLTWNAGECCAYAMEKQVDDVAFAVAVIDDIMKRARVDSARVYATGHSNGAMMAYWLAGERADRIVAIAPVAGSYNLEKFAPSRPVAVLDIHSVDDPRALYNGGLGEPFPGTQKKSSHRPVTATLQRWRGNNKCSTDSAVVETRSGKAGTPNAGQTATLIAWKGCAPGGEVAHWKLTGVGHGWPGDGTAGRRERIIGSSTTLVIAAEEVWKFVSKVKR